MSQLTPEIENALGLPTTRASLYLTTLDQLKEHPELAMVAYAVRHAWDILELNGVLFIDQQPAAYLKQSTRSFSNELKDKCVQFLWNHGTAPLLLLIEPTKIEVHSSMTRPPTQKRVAWSSSSLVETWEIVAEALEQNSLSEYLRKIETGQVYRDHQEKFDNENAVDRCLMENLHHLRNRLDFPDREMAHNLLGRVLFISFLCDRNFLQANHFPGTASNLREFFALNRGRGKVAVKLLYDELFAKLQKEFNGSMFSPNMLPEKKQMSPESFDLLADFLNGEEIESGQQMLPFSVYDFRHIPVETISAIYEDFLEAEDAEGKHELGAYYTPRHLAEMVVGIATQGGKNVGDWKFLDPSCGSGVFLVIAFNLLAEHWQFYKGNERRHKPTRINALLDILLNQIRGVDINPTACRIAAFSLYLALFEKVQPVELEEFKARLKGGPVLPNLLTATDANRDGLPTISRLDFVKNHGMLPNDFDCVVGNPPWGERGSKQKAFPFVQDAPAKVHPSGKTCLVLPTTMLVSEQGTMTKEWFGENTIDTIANLADFQNQLFVGPDYPCFIVSYSGFKPPDDHRIRYLTPKVSNYDNRRGLIALEPGDEKEISHREISACKNNESFRLLWVSRFQASERDLKFMRRLWMMPQLEEITGEPGDNRIFIRGVGFQPYYPGETKGDGHSIPEAWKSDPYLRSDVKLTLSITSENCGKNTIASFLSALKSRKGTKASTKLLRRKPDETIFLAPLLIHNKGFSEFAFFDQPGRKIRFQDALQVFKSANNDRRLVALLTAFFQSNLAKYLIYFSAAGWIAGRNQIHLEDKLHLPFPLPESPYAISNAESIADQILREFENLAASKEKFKELLDPDEIVRTKERLNELIFKYYGVGKNEQILVEDTCNILEPSKRPSTKRTKGRALLFPDETEIHAYQETLCLSLNQFASKFGATRRVAFADSLKPEKNSRLRLLILNLRNSERRRMITLSNEKAPSKRFAEIVSRMEHALNEEDGPFQYLRGFKYLEDDYIYILKPDILRHWTRTAALNDADEIIAHLAGQPRSSKQ